MLKEKVKKTISRYSLIPPGSRVLVALSGGPDSVALLHLLIALKDELKIDVAACHVNHGLRGEEAERDEEFVRALCSKLNVPLFVKRVKVDRGKRSLEEAAREERYRALVEALKEWGGDLIALGHTASDLTETILLNLTKGTGLKGLRGFLPKRDIFIRPLFEATRGEIEEFIEEEGLPYVLDSSNLDVKFERNLLRLKVVPHLRAINPSLERAFLRAARSVREAEEFIYSQVEPLLELYLRGGEFLIPLKVLKELHPFLRKLLIMEAYRRVSGKGLSADKVEQAASLIEGEGFKELQPHKGFKIYKEQDYLRISKDEPQGELYFKVESLPADVPVPGGLLKFRVNKGHPVAPLNQFKKAGIIVRSRRAGDKLKLGGFTKSLKKLLAERRIPAHQRWKVPLVEFNGEVKFIPSLYAGESQIKGPFVGVEFEPGVEGSNTSGDVGEKG